MNIVDFIGVGKENAVTRGELVALLNLPDRKVRRLIQEAREQGEIIINAQDGTGYYRSEDLDELERQYKANQHRAMSVLRQQRFLRAKISEAQNKEQMTLDEVRKQ